VGAPINWSWASGSYMDWGMSPANTNLDILRKGLLAPYLVGMVEVYKCPGDKVASANGQRVRSYSMNGQMGHAIYQQGRRVYKPPNYNSGYKTFASTTDLTDLNPTDAWIFIDEHAGSINDGYFQVSMSQARFPDLPASYHGESASVSFADGHAETRKWKDSRTVVPVVRGQSAQNTPAGANNVDLLWLRDHTTVRE